MTTRQFPMHPLADEEVQVLVMNCTDTDHDPLCCTQIGIDGYDCPRAICHDAPPGECSCEPSEDELR